MTDFVNAGREVDELLERSTPSRRPPNAATRAFFEARLQQERTRDGEQRGVLEALALRLRPTASFAKFQLQDLASAQAAIARLDTKLAGTGFGGEDLSSILEVARRVEVKADRIRLLKMIAGQSNLAPDQGFRARAEAAGDLAEDGADVELATPLDETAQALDEKAGPGVCGARAILARSGLLKKETAAVATAEIEGLIAEVTQHLQNVPPGRSVSTEVRNGIHDLVDTMSYDPALFLRIPEVIHAIRPVGETASVEDLDQMSRLTEFYLDELPGHFPTPIADRGKYEEAFERGVALAQRQAGNSSDFEWLVYKLYEEATRGRILAETARPLHALIEESDYAVDLAAHQIERALSSRNFDRAEELRSEHQREHPVLQTLAIFAIKHLDDDRLGPHQGQMLGWLSSALSSWNAKVGDTAEALRELGSVPSELARNLARTLFNSRDPTRVLAAAHLVQQADFDEIQPHFNEWMGGLLASFTNVDPDTAGDLSKALAVLSERKETMPQLLMLCEKLIAHSHRAFVLAAVAAFSPEADELPFVEKLLGSADGDTELAHTIVALEGCRNAAPALLKAGLGVVDKLPLAEQVSLVESLRILLRTAKKAR